MPKNPLYKGNTIDNFGRNLPVPYIDKIELYDIPTSELTETYVELGLTEAASEDFTGYLSPLSKIKLFVSFLIHDDENFDARKYIDTLHKDFYITFAMLTNKDSISSFQANRVNLNPLMIQYRTTTSVIAPANPFKNVFITRPLTDFPTEFAFTSEYDENDNAILKTSTITVEIYTEKLIQVSDMMVGVGVSSADPDVLLWRPPGVMALSYGDLAFEDIKVNGLLANRDRVGFFTESGEYYTGSPMVGTDGRYYKGDNFDAEDVKERLDELQASYQAAAQIDTELKTALTSVDYLYSTYGNTPEYLVQLNAYRRTLKFQDVNTPAGRYYTEYRNLINNVMVALAESEEVFKKITYSNKLRDHRPALYTPVNTATYDSTLGEEDFLYNKVLQTSLAKYVDARQTSPDGETTINPLYTPEAPYNPTEMRDAFELSIKTKLSRFYAESTFGGTTRTIMDMAGMTYSGTAGMMILADLLSAVDTSSDGFDADTPVGMDNVSNFLNILLQSQVDTAVTKFGRAYEAMQQMVDGSSGGGVRIYLGGYDMEAFSGTDFESSEVFAAIEGRYGEDWEDDEEYLAGLDASEFSVKRNWMAFWSAHYILGEKGNPRNGCTLEFGYDNSDGFDEHTKTHHGCGLMQHIIHTDIDGESITNIDYKAWGGSADDHKFVQYKCFKQIRPFINVAGYDNPAREDFDGFDTRTTYGGDLVYVDRVERGGAAHNPTADRYDRTRNSRIASGQFSHYGGMTQGSYSDRNGNEHAHQGYWYYEDEITENRDYFAGDSRFGYYAFYTSEAGDEYSSSMAPSWALKSKTWFTDKIRTALMEDDYLFGTSQAAAGKAVKTAGGKTADGNAAAAEAPFGDDIKYSIQTMFDLILNLFLGLEEEGHSQSLFINLLDNTDSWNELVSSWNLIDLDGNLNTTNVMSYATDFANQMEDVLFLALDTLVGADSDCKTYRLRWCPSQYVSTTDGVLSTKYDTNASSDDNPYGGNWWALYGTRTQRSPDGTAHSEPVYLPEQTTRNHPYYWQGGFYRQPDKFRLPHLLPSEQGQLSCGASCRTRLNADPHFAINSSPHIYDFYVEDEGYLESAGAGDYGAVIPGRAVHNFCNSAILAVKALWRGSFRTDVVDVIQDIIPLLSDWHGVNMSLGQHSRLAYTDIIVQKYGWFFFDMEKYMAKQSNISQYMNPRSIERFFEAGRDMMNMSVKIDEVKLHRWDAPKEDQIYADDFTRAFNNDGCHVELTLNKDNSTSAQPTTDVSIGYQGYSNRTPPAPPGAEGMLTTINSLDTDLPYPYIRQMDVATWNDLCVAEGNLHDTTHGPGLSRTKSYNQYSYLMQRNYDFTGNALIPNEYRLACFSYNYYVDDDVALRSGDAYQISVKIRDRSQRVVQVIINELSTILEEYDVYAEFAAENCAFNMFDGQFNAFFINKMNEQYEGRMDEAPWQKASVAITLLEDLLFMRYGGELSVIYEAANSISDNINPYTGTLEQVRYWQLYFATKLEDLLSLRTQIREDHYDYIDGQYVQKSESQYKYYKMGNSMNDYDTKRDEVIITQGIVDYAADHTDTFPELPDNSVGQDQDAGTF